MNSKHFLRNLVLALAVINLVFWLWTQGYLRMFGIGPKPVHEPHRIENQVDPDLLTLQKPEPATK
jgi:hypothetical protein